MAILAEQPRDFKAKGRPIDFSFDTHG